MSVAELERARAAARGAGREDKGVYVRDMFSAIAPRYDLLNTLLSFRLDRSWRRRAIAALDVSRNPGGAYLDLCAGTLDLATAIVAEKGFRGTVVGADFAEPMLRKGRERPGSADVAAVAADALALPVANGAFAGAVVGFGIRNVTDLDAALREVARVLAPRGRFVILEFTTPPNRIVRAGYHAYFHHVLPRIGALLSGHSTAYSYLPESVSHFPSPAELGKRMERAGFTSVRWESMMMGVVALHIGER